MNKDIQEMALMEAVETVLSDLGDLLPEEILNRLDDGEIPDEIVIWYPFEECDARTIADHIRTFARQFERFAERVREGEL